MSLCGCVLFCLRQKEQLRHGDPAVDRGRGRLPSLVFFVFAMRAGIEMGEVDTDPHAAAFYYEWPPLVQEVILHWFDLHIGYPIL